MRLRDVLHIIRGKPISSDTDLDCEVRTGFASDLMSDVLRYDGGEGLLVTGLANPQVVRTAEMAEVTAILIVRGKVPPPETMALAREVGIPILGTEYTMFESCGLLYSAGLPTCSRRNGQHAAGDG
jgi:predicted transcriptional regulator